MKLFRFKSSDRCITQCINHNLSNSATELFPLKTLWVRPKVRQDVETLNIIYIVAYTILVSN